MRRITQIGLLAIACVCGLLIGRAWNSPASSVYAQGAAPSTGAVVQQGRFQVANISIGGDHPGTMMIDSQVGHAYLLVTVKDKSGNDIQAFQQIPISSCMDITCSEYTSHLHPDFEAEGQRR
ncbi:MAG TPA: hypothetical protein VFW94_11620 [Candidatus Acidoferrales bacterium]|nr:hypothetical protein [Candidatus Acidoferrales bacterium]